MLQQRQKVLAKARVNAIAPGVVYTEGTRIGGIRAATLRRRWLPGTPLGRFGQPDDIARIAVFLASQDSAWLTKLLTASGGYR
jgi:3-oxoacyl-[acyl-carrier protein] reductase